jgi:16S rRNA (cytosine1407-C5)-methyltransferase
MDTEKSSVGFPAFDRYEPFTDLAALNNISATPLRKSIRVNTLKISVEDFLAYGKEKGWVLTPVPWCLEAFFIDRENREEALGRDILHLLGGFYMQESASMLPAELLQAEPGDTVLDMSAAPGSKTTEIGAKMQGRGVILANDIQEKRLWTLKSAIHRSGVTNVIVTKKVGQWFAKHMTERFDRVLCDAPCTAQGTVRKDSDALRYCSIESVEKMSRLQYQLLESAIHSTKVGGRIIYSTCTLTPEENEGVIFGMLERFPDQLEVVDPRTLHIAPDGYWDKAIEDSIMIQKTLNPESPPQPLLRLWPQTYDTEGFFSAVLRKTAPTKNVEPMDRMKFQELELPRSRKNEINNILKEQYGADFLSEEDRIFERGEMLLLSNQDVAHFNMPLENYALGIPFGKRLKDGRISHTSWTSCDQKCTDRERCGYGQTVWCAGN